MIELVALDIGGTVVQEHGAVYAALGAAVGANGRQPSADDVRLWMGAGKREAVRELLSLAASGAPPAETVDRVYDDFQERLLDAYRRRPPTPFEGVPDALAALRAEGVKVALTTGFERAIADPLLTSVGWDDAVVDAVVCSDEVARGRPAPYMIFRAMEATGIVDVDRVLVAGDTVRDLEAGVGAGARAVVGVLTGSTDATTLGRVRHTHILASVAELPALVGEGVA